jgi:hypothetical protein
VMSNQSANTCDRRLPPLIFHRLASLRETVVIKKESREHKKTPDPFNLHPCCSKNCRERRGISSRPSGVVEFLVAGQGSVCITCYTHHLSPRMKKGAPIGYMFSEGIGTVSATAVFKNAPHPNSAWLFFRWVLTDEGQKAFGIEGRMPANPKIEPVEKTGLEKVYTLGEKDSRDFSKYEKIWKGIFKLR